MNWNPLLLQSLYASIEAGDIDYELFKQCLPDLANLNLKDSFPKNHQSRTSLEKGTLEINGTTYKLNKEFIFAAIKISDDLNLDELAITKLLINSQNDPQKSNNTNDSISLINLGKVQYYLSRQYILQIVNYIVNCSTPGDKLWDGLLSTKSNNQNSIATNILLAFDNIHKELREIKESIDKAMLLDITNTIVFKKDIKFRRDFLLKEYDILSTTMFGLVNHGTLLNKQFVIDIINNVSKLDANDYFIVYHIPSIIQAFVILDEMNDQDVLALHSKFIQDLTSDGEIYTKPIKVTIIFLFLCYFIGWCKKKPDSRAVNIDFKTQIDEPMMKAVSLGALEQLLILTADTSETLKTGLSNIYYDMRALLERHIPRLVPVQLYETSNGLQQKHMLNALSSTGSSLDITSTGSPVISLSEQSESIFLTTLNNAIQTIISNGAFLLTKIKDEEEDSLLSGEDLNLDDISVKADLERFFLATYYFFFNRPSLSKEFWSDNESDAYGFIEWASKCTDSLMRSCFYIMISGLSHNEENSLNIYHFFNNGNTVSWAIISQCISDYIIKINNLTQVISLRQQQNETEDVDQTTIALEEGLNEETIIFLSSLLSLIGSVAKDINYEFKEKISEIFIDILFEFVKVETPLVGAIFKTISHLVHRDETKRIKIWRSLDTLIFSNTFTLPSSDSYKTSFSSLLGSYSEIMGFLNLFHSLTENESLASDNNFLTFGKLTFPERLGQGYRKVGVWPYYEYILNELFVNSFKMRDYQKKEQLQLTILNIITNGLSSFDYSVILNSNIANVDLNKLVSTTNFFSYVHESAAVVLFNYIFTEKIFTGIYKLMSIGVDNLRIDIDGGHEQKMLIQSSLQIVKMIFKYQDTYLEELCPIIVKQRIDNYFVPRRFGSHGLKSFFDTVVFNLSAIAHLGLYIGSDDNKLASESLQILQIISLRYNNDNFGSNIILTTFDSVDESARIKESFIFRIDRPIETLSDLSVKLGILDYIADNLTFNDLQPTVSHLLLGFQVTNIISMGPDLNTFISSGTSLLQSLINLLISALNALSPNNVNYAPMRLASQSIGILMKLCRNPLTANLTLDYLAEQELFSTLLSIGPQVSKYTQWNGRMYDNNSAEDCKIFIETESIGALLSFLSFRGCLLQYLSLSIHRLSFHGTPSQTKLLIEELTSNAMYSAGIFSFLDSSNLGNFHKEHDLRQNLNHFKFLPISLENIQLTNYLEGNIYDFTNLNSLLNLYTRSKLSTSLNSTNPELEKEIKSEYSRVKQFATNNISHSRVLELLLLNVHTWVQLVQIVVTDGGMETLTRSNFILQVFSTVVPKINDYVEYDIAFSEELVSLCVFLFDIYHKDCQGIGAQNKFDVRLYELFKACIHGINSSVTSPSLRSDFYVLANNYLTDILKDEYMVKNILHDLQMNSSRLIDIICSDAVSGEGTNRITSILLLDSLFQLGTHNKDNFILESLASGTHLLLLILSIKNIDSHFKISLDNVTLSSFLYELTVLKTTVNMLTRIAQYKGGAQLLIRNKLFSSIEECDYLSLDPDVGLNLLLENINGNKINTLSFNVTRENMLQAHEDPNNISLLELYIPIFQLLSAVVIVMGSSNKSTLQSVRGLLNKHNKLCSSILKKSTLIHSSVDKDDQNPSKENLKILTRLIVILCSLTSYQTDNMSNMFVEIK
ncbi:hypothetical protein TPHA_0E02340 [Tetrapisispora phaffii CBS 4417]|uniref:Nucleoporin n=1 Tax=Tetrapisispora phaffii (strain ATCC 24235 / CBS 4417 / NBRC 1672 / NRRL Y-8282 / UCD 70-5) TaxID=1071381 RepID=G8BTU8_TETPH|nr:hypothetical protein TPHA_0E02340 [Tetrapisispora phaffii CBS 4417]CCE63326.1 hypothetical protein TPHA_0E02340 [Tetrapisispora phaffii CBS 4417]